MKIKYCPICMQELIPISMITYQCPYCKAAFHISVEYSIDNPCLTIDDERE